MSMDPLAVKKFPMKQVVSFGFLVVAFFFILAIVHTSMMGNQQSFSLATQSAGAPMYNGADFAPGMAVSDGYYAQRAEVEKSIGYDSSVTADRIMMPMPPSEPSAPTGVSQIIKNADLALVVEDVDASAQMIEAVRKEFGGQVGNASFYDYGTTRSGDIIIWVPSAQFDAAIVKVKEGALRVATERISVSDVSAQFVDIEAQIKNLRATEAQYLEIMKRSGNIADILNVSRELSQTRGTIERLQGQLNYLSRQVALSSIHITLTQETASGIAKNEWRPLTVVTAAFRENLRDLTGFVDMLLILLVRLPVLLLWVGFLVLICYGVWHLGGFFYARVKRCLPTKQGEI